jgi:hypothetical protein
MHTCIEVWLKRPSLTFQMNECRGLTNQQDESILKIRLVGCAVTETFRVLETLKVSCPTKKEEDA